MKSNGREHKMYLKHQGKRNLVAVVHVGGMKQPLLVGVHLHASKQKKVHNVDGYMKYPK